MKEVTTIKRKVREIIISDIQDTLHDKYMFYINEPEQYLNSELQRLLIRIDCMFNTFVRECLLSYNV
jgi:dynein heavy chain